MRLHPFNVEIQTEIFDEKKNIDKKKKRHPGEIQETSKKFKKCVQEAIELIGDVQTRPETPIETIKKKLSRQKDLSCKISQIHLRRRHERSILRATFERLPGIQIERPISVSFLEHSICSTIRCILRLRKLKEALIARGLVQRQSTNMIEIQT